MLAALAEATRRQEICALVDATDSFDPASAATAGIDLNRLLWVRCSERLTVPCRKEKAASALGRPARDSFAFASAVEQVLKVSDLLLQGGGFGMVALDLGDVPPESMRRVPLTSWFRFRRAVEPTATVLLVVEQEPWAKTCASLVVQLRREEVCARNSAPNPGRPITTEGWQVLHTSKARRDGHFHDSEAGESLGTGEDGRAHVPDSNVVSHAALLRGMNFRAEIVRSWTQRKPPHSAGARFGLRAAL
jgi:hypothetical protein